MRLVVCSNVVFDYNSKLVYIYVYIAIYFSIRPWRCTLRRRFLAHIISHTTSRSIVTPITQLLVSPNWIIPPFSALLLIVTRMKRIFRSPLRSLIDLSSRFKNFPRIYTFSSARRKINREFIAFLKIEHCSRSISLEFNRSASTLTSTKLLPLQIFTFSLDIQPCYRWNDHAR